MAFRGATPVAQVADLNGEVIKNRRTNSVLDLTLGMADSDLSSESFRRDAVAGFEQVPDSSHPGDNFCQYRFECGLPTIVRVANQLPRAPYGDNRSRRAITYEFSASAAASARPPKGLPSFMTATHGRFAAKCARSHKECRSPAMERFQRDD